jgi:hypothetical protein
LSAAEFGFLALGFLLGIATGAAIFEVLRSRPPAPRDVRLIVTPDSVPRRAPATLATGASAAHPAPTASSPTDATGGDERVGATEGAPTSPPGGLPSPFAASAPASGPVGAQGRVGIAIHREPDPTLAALRRLADGGAELVGARVAAMSALVGRPEPRTAAEPASPPPARTPGRLADHGPDNGPEANAAAANDATSATLDAAEGVTEGVTEAASARGPCAEPRRLAEERCAHAGRAKENAEAAHDALRRAQRAYDDHLTNADRAGEDADPRAIRAAKEQAQHAFRASRSAARTPEEIEAAARDWLTEINRINVNAREAGVRLERERAAANALVAEIERLTVEADAARIGAEAADEACLTARELLADCEEAAAAPIASEAHPAQPGTGTDGDQDQDDVRVAARFERDEAAIALATGDTQPVILRLVRGDRAALGEVVAALASDDLAERRRWQAHLAGLVEAIVARAIEASVLEFPTDGTFWAPFTRGQNRDIVAALSSLGYRFDGLGGWLDDRVPSQRDLSLAVGYAGLDPMRIRHWPNEAEMPGLFHNVRVSADEYLVETAPDLTLGELVSALGVRADGLADLWNEWGRVRRVLLSGG